MRPGSRRRARSRPIRAWRCRATLSLARCWGRDRQTRGSAVRPGTRRRRRRRLARRHHDAVGHGALPDFPHLEGRHTALLIDRGGDRVKHQRRGPERLARRAALEAGTGIAHARTQDRDVMSASTRPARRMVSTSCRRRALVGEVRREPLLDLLDRLCRGAARTTPTWSWPMRPTLKYFASGCEK